MPKYTAVHVISFITQWLLILKPFNGFVRTILHFKYNITIVRVLVKMWQDCNTTIYIFAVFVVSLYHCQCKMFSFYINYYYWATIMFFVGMRCWTSRVLTACRKSALLAEYADMHCGSCIRPYSSSTSTTKEPNGITNVDGKLPDGLTLILWKAGKLLDVTVVCTFDVSYVDTTSRLTGETAELAALGTSAKYAIREQ